MKMDTALEIVLDLAFANVADDVDHPEEHVEQMKALEVVQLARPFLATALKMAWQGAEPKPVRDRRRALDLGGRNEHAGP